MKLTMFVSVELIFPLLRARMQGAIFLFYGRHISGIASSKLTCVKEKYFMHYLMELSNDLNALTCTRGPGTMRWYLFNCSMSEGGCHDCLRCLGFYFDC